MDTGRGLGQIVSRLRDQRFLFLLGVIIALAVLAPLDVISPAGVIIIFSVSAGVVVVDRILEYFKPRSGQATGQARGLTMSIAVDFEGESEGMALQLKDRAEYTIQDPRNPGQLEAKEVLLHEGPGGTGWLCPIPSEVEPDNMVSFTFTAVDGRQWRLNLVPGLLWPRTTAKRLS